MQEDDNGVTSEDVVQDIQETQDSQEVLEPKTIDDTLRETLREIGSRSNDNKNKSETEPKIVEETNEPKLVQKEKSPRNRDEKGKFKESIDNTETTPMESDTQAPNTWKKEAQAAWGKADPILKAEILRREADFHKGIEQYKQAAQFAQSMDAAITPYKATLQKLGIAPDRAIAELMGYDHKLRYGTPQEKQACFMHLAHSYGVDLGQAADTQRNTDPNMYNLQMQNQQLQNQLMEQRNAIQRQTEASLNSEIAQFASDPKNVHFETVKGHMAALLQAGQAQNLQDAYDQAIYANPTTRAAVLQQQAQAAKEEASKRAQAAKMAASVNVKSRPAVQPQEAIGTMEDTIRSVLRKSQGLI